MTSNFNPVRDLWVGASFFNGGTVGTPVPLANFVGPITVMVIAGPGVVATRTITFEGAAEDPANICNPLLPYSAMNKGGFCDDVSALSVVINPAADPYLTDDQQICREALQCPAAFVRAVLSVADPAIQAVVFMGKARRLDQV